MRSMSGCVKNSRVQVVFGDFWSARLIDRRVSRLDRFGRAEPGRTAWNDSASRDWFIRTRIARWPAMKASR